MNGHRFLLTLTLTGALLASPSSGQLSPSQFVRNSVVNPNPLAYGLDPVSGPRIGGTWTPTVSNAPGLFVPPPATSIFFVGISTGPSVPEIFLGPAAGTLLIDFLPPNPILLVGPIAGGSAPLPAPIQIPNDCSFVGLSLSTQAALVDTLTGVRLANAIDITIGHGVAGLYTVATWDNTWANPDANLRRVSMSTGATLATIPMTMPGFNVVQAHGLARNPLTDELFVVLTADPSRSSGPGQDRPGARKKRGTGPGTGAGRARGGTSRHLAIVCPLTGVCTPVGPLANSLSGIAFDLTGTLWGVSGDGGTPMEALYTVNTSTAALTPERMLGAGNDGEFLAFNAQDGLLYHGSGLPPPSTNLVLETLVPTPGAVPAPVAVPVTAPLDIDEPNALSELDLLNGHMWWVAGCCTPSQGSTLYTFDPTVPGGGGTLVGMLDHIAHGIAVVY
jgi:hypothetical protein